MAGRIAVGKLSSFICQKNALPTRLPLFGRAQQTLLVRFLRCGCIRPMSRKIKCICEIMNLQYMKKFYLSLVLAMVCVLGLEAQTPAELRAQFAQSIQTYQKKLPKKYDNGVKITQVEVTDNDFVMYIDVPDEQVGDFEQFKTMLSLYKGNFVKTLYEAKDVEVALFAKTGLNLKVNIRAMPSKKETVFAMTAAELELAKGLSVNPDQLPSIVEEMRKTLPQEWGDGLSLTDLYLEQDNLVYKIKTDESVLTINLLDKVDNEDGENTVKYVVLTEITALGDDNVKAFVNALIEVRLGIKIVFWSDQSAKQVTFFVSPEEVKENLGTMY